MGMWRSLLILLLLPVSLGCLGSPYYNPMYFDDYLSGIDGTFEGRVWIDKPGIGFDRSFNAVLEIGGDGEYACLWDDRGNLYNVDHINYYPYSRRLEIFFRVLDYEWSDDCGWEVYDWEMRMNGFIYYSTDQYKGELEVDIDPEDYDSEFCYLGYDPPPTHLGSFDLARYSGY